MDSLQKALFDFQLEEQLRKNTLLFHYNAWEKDFYDEPLIAILSVLIEALNSPLQNGFLEWIAEDKEFLSKYDTIMQTLTA